MVTTDAVTIVIGINVFTHTITVGIDRLRAGRYPLYQLRHRRSRPFYIVADTIVADTIVVSIDLF